MLSKTLSRAVLNARHSCLRTLGNSNETVHWSSEEVHDLHTTTAQSTNVIHHQSAVWNVIAPDTFISASADTAPVD
jgi:hypothetical protein